MIKQITLVIVCLLVFGAAISQNTFTQQIQGTPNGLVDQDVQTRDQVINDDLIVFGSLCVGVDCVNNENFGFDTFRLKENNLRIHFDDTSNSASFPNNDWRITINDSGNGGDNHFSIDDATAATNPFRIEAGAGNNALHVSSSGGNVGLGTNTPVVELQITDGDSPTMRLEQNGSAGFGAQTWDIAGNETNFFIRDVTNGSDLPFRIRPGAGDNALFIQNTGNIGLGTDAPNADARLELAGTDRGLLLNRLTTVQRTAFVPSEAGMMIYDTDEGSLYTWDGATWQGGITDTDNQTADVFQLNGNNLELSLEDDGAATQQVDLSSFLDNTDDQTADVFQLNGNNLELSLEDDGAATQQVDLTGFLDNTDDQTADVFQLNGNNLELSLEDDGAATQQVDLTGFLDNTDDQTADVFQLNGNNLELSLEDDGAATQQVDLTGFLDNTDDQTADVFQLNGNNLELSLEDDGAATQQVDLSGFLDNTDDQTADVFQLNGNNLELSLENDGAATQQVDLSGYLDNTDNQNIAGSGLAGTDLTIGISGGSSQTIDLSSLDDAGTDDQNISGSVLVGTDLTIGIEGGTSETVDLSSLDDSGTDDQNISGSVLFGTDLTIGIEGGTSETVDLSSLDDSGTDDQNISGSVLVGTDLTIGIEGGTSETIDLSSLNNAGTDDQTLGNFLLTNQILSLTIENGNGVNVDLGPLIQPLEDENAAQQAQIDALLANAAAQQAQIDDLIDRIEVLEDCACTTLDAPDFDPNGNGRAYLYQNVPNPFGNTTSIGYFIPLEHSRANLLITTTEGKVLSNIAIREFGEGSIEFNKATLQSAMYFYTLYVDGERVDTKRMLVE